MNTNPDLTINLFEVHQSIKTQLGLITPAEAKRSSTRRLIVAGELQPAEAYNASREALIGSFPAPSELTIDEQALSTAIEAAIESALLDLKL